MASPRVKNDYQGAALSFARVLAFTCIVLITGFSAWVIALVAGAPLGIAGAIGGSLAGFVGFLVLVYGSLYEVNSFTCPACGHTDKTLKQIGYYNCHNCQTKFYFYDNETRQITTYN